MALAFKTDKDCNIVSLIQNGKVAIRDISRIDGFELVAMKVIDVAINNTKLNLEENKVMSESPIKNKSNTLNDEFSVGFSVVLMVGVLFVFSWISGVVIASGLWLKVLASFFFPYALYLFTEVILKHMSLIPL